MSREDLHFRLRLPKSVKDRIEEAAKRRGHSMTTEIVLRLQYTMAADSLDEKEELVARLRRMADRIEQS